MFLTCPVKVLDKDINSKSSRVQDALGAAEKVLEKTTDPKQKARLQELADKLKMKYEDLANKSDNRVDVLEETLPLAIQFNETHGELAKWLDDMEAELKEDKPVPLEPEELRKEVEENRVGHSSLISLLATSPLTFASSCCLNS